MSKNVTPTVDFGNGVKLLVMQCRACRKFLGYSERRAVMFCPDDPFCATTREWVWENDRLTDFIVQAHEVDGISLGDVSRALGLRRSVVYGIYKTYKQRKFQARM